MRRIVLIGNCQIHALSNLYRQFASDQAENELLYVRSYEDIPHAHRRAIEIADLLVIQVLDAEQKGSIAGITTKAERLFVPNVNCGFFWPFAGQPRPQNPTPPFHIAGPYGAESSDAYLNRMINKGIDPEAAVKNYVELDVNKVMNLDRLFEMGLEKQRRRDGLAGFQIAEVIAEHFRDEPLFLSPHHPNIRIALSLASQFFKKMGVSAAATTHMQRALRVTPFPKGELPYHPSVRRHYGLRFVGDNSRYRFMNEDRFTFEEFALRYMRCEWNEALQEGLTAMLNADYKSALRLLERGLTRTPDSAAGRSALAAVYERLGRTADAIDEIVKVIGLDSECAAYRNQFGTLLNRSGNAAGAEQQFRLAAALDPFDANYTGMLASFLRQQGQVEEALCVARHGINGSPRAIYLRLELGHIFVSLGEQEHAEAAFREALRLAPSDPQTLRGLADLLASRGRAGEAVELLKGSLEKNVGNPAIQAQLVDLLVRTGDWLAAERLAREAIEKFPTTAGLWIGLGRALQRLKRVDEAIVAVSSALAIEPSNISFRSLLVDFYIDSGNVDRAEKVARAAVAECPGHTHLLYQLSSILSRKGLQDEAIAIRREVISIDPRNAHRHAQLAHLLLHSGDFGGAEQAYLQAMSLAPDNMTFLTDLSRLLQRPDQIENAINVARESLARQTQNESLLVFLGDMYERINDHARAEQAYRDALTIQPQNKRAQTQLIRFGSLGSPRPELLATS